MLSIAQLCPSRLCGLLLTTITLCTSTASAKPMNAPSEDGRCKEAAVVIEGEYTSYRPSTDDGSITYFQPPVALFRNVRVIHGQQIEGEVPVRFDFTDGSACDEPANWDFTADLLPTIGSHWILFLKAKDSTADYYDSHRGNFGRMPVDADSSKVLQRCQTLWDSMSQKGSSSK